MTRYVCAVFSFWCALSLGCAGLTAKKVPLAKRLEGRDGRIDGFRYYLSRPYFVVSDRIPVVEYQEQGPLRKLNLSGSIQPVVALIREGQIAIIDLSGNYLGGPKLYSHTEPYEVTPISLEALPPPTRPKGQVNTENPLPSITTTGVQIANGTEDTPPVEETTKAFQVVFLPDFEEQMVIHHKNCLARGKLTLGFADGWQLQTVNGSFDSTDVAVKLLDSIKSAIGAATELQDARIKARGTNGGGGGGTTELAGFRADQTKILITTKLFIEPGMYRLNKPSEQMSANSGVDFLDSLGVPVVEERQVSLLGTEAQQ